MLDGDYLMISVTLTCGLEVNSYSLRNVHRNLERYRANSKARYQPTCIDHPKVARGSGLETVSLACGNRCWVEFRPSSYHRHRKPKLP